jgi:hypothetical protein
MDRMTAYCGLDCSKCEGYIATQSNDRKAIESVAEKWRKQYNSENITAESVMCDGCTKGGRMSGYCSSMCKIRQCAVKKAVVNCAYCTDYESCQELKTFHSYPGTAEAKAILDGIRMKNN